MTRELIQRPETVARDAAEGFIQRQAAQVVQHLAFEALRSLELARLTGALPDEVGFTYEIVINARLR